MQSMYVLAGVDEANDESKHTDPGEAKPSPAFA